MSQSKASTYLVTGAAGFIGSSFVDSCNQRNIRVISVDSKKHFLERTEHQTVRHDQILDRDQLMGWLQSQRPQLQGIVHLGAITDTRETNEELLQRLNLHYSQALWDYASAEKIPFVYASSAATYGDGILGYDDDENEIAKLSPLNLYGESKHKFDLWALKQEKNHNQPPHWCGFKFFNVYGFGERHKGFMSSVVFQSFNQIQELNKATLFKSHRPDIPDGFQKRDFIFIDDVIEVLHFAIEKPILRGIYNLGTGQARTFLKLTQSVFQALGKPENIFYIDTPLKIRDQYQYFTEAKMDRLRKQGYLQAFTPLEEGVLRYVRRLKNE